LSRLVKQTNIPHVPDGRLADVARLIREFKQQPGAETPAPEDVRQHVAQSLGVSPDVARHLIIEAGLRVGTGQSQSRDGRAAEGTPAERYARAIEKRDAIIRGKS
jgi:hypothetical protein